MCDQPHYDKLRDRVCDLEKTQAAQTEQIKTLFAVTAAMQQSLSSTFNKVLWALFAVMMVAVLGLAYGALGEKGFNSVTGAAKEYHVSK